MSWRGRVLFYSQLKQILNTGMPLSDAVPLAAGAAQPYQTWSTALSQGCAAGRPLGEVLEEQGEAPLICALVSAGEHSGRLPELLDEIISITDNAIATRQLIIGKAVYPTVLLHAALVIPMFPAWFLGKSSGFSLFSGVLILWSIIGALVLAVRLTRGSDIFARLALRKPLRALTAHYCTASTCLVLHAGAMAGLLWPESLRLAAGAAGNRIWSGKLKQAAEDINAERTPDLTTALRQADYPADIVHMVSSGEHAGDTEGTLKRAALLERERFQSRLQWTARAMMGVIYTAAVLFAALTIIRMAMAVYIQPTTDALNSMP